MTDLRNTCKDSNEYIKKLVVEYKENHIKLQERELLVGENNIEKRDIKGYHGREILELLQNADDAYQKSIKEGNKPNKPLEVCISYKLLFLPNISKISINTDNKNIIYKRSNLSLDKTTNELNLSDYKIKNLKKDSEREYSINYELLNPNNEFGDAIANDVDAQRMIYFKREDDFSVWLERQRQILEYQNKKQYNDVYAEKRNSIPNKKEINFQKNNEKNSHINAQQNSDDTKFPIERTYTKNDIDEKNEHLKGIGNTGELVIYNYLCKEYGKENVFPRSEAFVTLGILKAGQARSSTV